MSLKDRKEREREARKKEILDAALKLFSRKGYEETSMDEIAERAELSKGILYYYFHSKEELFYEVALRETSNFYRRAYDAVKNMRDAFGVFSILIDFYIEYFSKRKDILGLIFPFGKSSPILLKKEFREKIAMMRKPLEEKVNASKKGCASGIFEVIWSYVIGMSIKLSQGMKFEDLKQECETFKKMLNELIK